MLITERVLSIGEIMIYDERVLTSFHFFFVKSLMERLKPSSLAVSIIFSGFAPKSLKRRK